MVQIDDAGSGSLIGGTCIGAIRAETGEYFYDFIPLKYYRGYDFQSKKYLNKCCEIVLQLLKLLNTGKDETIQICRGYMFDIARDQLINKGYNIESTKIGDPLQDRVENTFQEYALSMGLPKQYVEYTKYPLHFHRILRWVYADYNNRKSLCKTGWKSWKKYGSLEINTYYDVIYNNNYTCLKCGRRINKNSKVKVLKYLSNCPNTIYLHAYCESKKI